MLKKHKGMLKNHHCSMAMVSILGLNLQFINYKGGVSFSKGTTSTKTN